MALSQARIKAAVFHALSYWAGTNTSRDDLEPGAMPLDIKVSGFCHKTAFTYDLEGILMIGHDQTVASSTGPKADELLAVMLSNPTQTVGSALNKIEMKWQRDKTLPAAQPEATKRVAALMKSLRAAGPSQKRRGSVRFEECQPDQPAAKRAA